MKIGLPPTALNARTGEETPPGMSWRAFKNAASELAVPMERIITGKTADARWAQCSDFLKWICVTTIRDTVTDYSPQLNLEDYSTIESSRQVMVIETMVVFGFAVFPLLYSSWLHFFRPLQREPVSVRDNFIAHLFRYVEIVAPVLFIIWRSGDRWSFFGIKRFRLVHDVSMAVAIYVASALFLWIAEWGLRAILPVDDYRRLMITNTAKVFPRPTGIE